MKVEIIKDTSYFIDEESPRKIKWLVQDLTTNFFEVGTRTQVS